MRYCENDYDGLTRREEFGEKSSGRYIYGGKMDDEVYA